MSEKADKAMERIKRVTPKNKTEPYNVWFDETAPGEEFTHAAMMTRMKDVHGIDTANTKGTRSMVMHMDGDTWFSYVWEWTTAGKKFTNSTRQNRRGMDRDIWANGRLKHFHAPRRDVRFLIGPAPAEGHQQNKVLSK